MAPIIAASIQLSFWHIVAIFVFIGFLFHYLHKSEYKRFIIGSILIGGILGVSLWLVLNKNIELANIQLLLRPVLIGIVSVLAGGVIAVSLKKVVKILKRKAKPNVEQISKNECK